MAESGDLHVDPSLIEPHYSTIIYKGYLYYLEQRLGLDQAKAVVEKIGLTWEYLTKDTNWVSEKFAELFYDVLVAEPAVEKDFSYQAGKYAMSKEVQGAVHILAIQLLDPQYIFRQVLYFSKQFNKVDTLEIKKLSKNSLSFEMTAHRKTKHFELFIQNWIGFCEQVPVLHGLPSSECTVLNKSEYSTTIEVKWASNRLFINLKRTQFLVFIGTLILEAFHFRGVLLSGVKSVNLDLILHVLFTGISSFLVISLMIEKLRQKLQGNHKNTLSRLLKESEDRYGELFRGKVTLDRRYKEANILAAVIQRISSSQDAQSLIQTTVREVQESLQYDRVLYMAHDANRNTLSSVLSQGFDFSQERLMSNYEIDLNTVTANSFHLGNVFKQRTSVLVPVTADYFSTLSEEGKSLLVMIKSRSFLICTVATQSTAYGVLMVDYSTSEKVLDQEDLKFIQNIANQLAICLENANNLALERRLRSAFQRFVPREVVQSMMGENRYNLEAGISDNMTVLFSDFRQFTKRSSMVPSHLLIKALNTYFAHMTEIVYKHKGIVERFMGDGMLAVFNAFGDNPEHSLKAVQAAYDMQDSLPELDRKIKKTLFQNYDWPPLDVSIGLHTGPLIVGNLGTESKTEFTSIGETVNVTARICEISKKYPSSILISEEVCQRISNQFETESIGSCAIRGIDRELTLYLVKGQNMHSIQFKDAA